MFGLIWRVRGLRKLEGGGIRSNYDKKFHQHSILNCYSYRNDNKRLSNSLHRRLEGKGSSWHKTRGHNRQGCREVQGTGEGARTQRVSTLKELDFK